MAGQDAAGQNTTRQNAAGQNTTGQNTTRQNAAGRDAASRDAASRDTTGQNTTGQDTTGQDTTGQNAAGHDTAGQDATGRDAAGRDAAGRDAAGRDAGAGQPDDADGTDHLAAPADAPADVLVVGAGPTGLTVACSLLLHGVSPRRVRLVDQAAGPAETSRANILHARGVEVLDRIGAVGDLADQAVSAMRVTMHVNGSPVTLLQFGDPGAQRARAALVVSQAVIEAGLRRRLTDLGGTIEWSTRVTGIRQTAATDGDTSGVTVTFADGRELRAGWVVGCDGAHSTVREVAGVGFPGAPVAEHFLLADVHSDWDRDRSGTAGWYTRDGLFLAMPMRDPDGRDDRWRMMADVTLADGERLDGAAVVDRLQAMLGDRVGRPDVRIADAPWTSVFQVQRRLADTYRRGRVLLAGDAAHVHSPMGGQGMNTGIGDAENLGWKLALVVDGVADGRLLDTYQRERRGLAADVVRGTTAATRLQVGDGPAFRFLRDRVFVPLVNHPAIQRRLTYRASQLWVTYAGGPLADGPAGRLRRRPRPGDRVPDLPCRTAAGTATTVHRELGGRWAVLAGGSDGAVGAEVRRRLGARLVTLRCDAPRPGAVWLVRPDGHLAWRGRVTDGAGVGRWLEAALGGVR